MRRFTFVVSCLMALAALAACAGSFDAVYHPESRFDGSRGWE